jgi:hypothetical protein
MVRQPGNQNAVKHGRHCAAQRAQRRAACAARLVQEAHRHAEWMKTIPHTDYAAICAAIQGSTATKH